MDDVVRAGEDSAQSPAGWIATAGNADADPKDAQGQGDDPGQTECSTATASALGGTSASDGGAVSREDRIVFRGCDVEVRNLEKSFGDRVLWSGLNFDLHPGDMVGLVGPSGCGKSTLLNCLGLLETPTSGTIVVDGKESTAYGGHSRRLFRRNRLGYLFQDYALIDNATVRKNIDVALVSVPRRDRRKAVAGALRIVGLEGRENDVVSIMSGGERQRVALARILVKRPGLVLADEPTGALDKGNEEKVVRCLQAMAHDGATIVIATHSPSVAAACVRLIDLGRADVASGEGDG